MKKHKIKLIIIFLFSILTLGFAGEAFAGMLKVSDSPFYPHEGDPYGASITVTNTEDETMTATLRIYNINGYAVRELVNNDDIDPGVENSYTWNGLDDYGNDASMGIYIVYLEMWDRAEGTSEMEMNTVVLGRRF